MTGPSAEGPATCDGRGHRTFVSHDDGATMLAITCTRENARSNETWIQYRQIYDADIYFNMELASSPDWWVGSSVPPQSDRFDFGGVLTHELGHAAGTGHYTSTCTNTSTAWVTMCPSVANNLQSYWNRSLHADDEDTVDNVYPS